METMVFSRPLHARPAIVTGCRLSVCRL